MKSIFRNLVSIVVMFFITTMGFATAPNWTVNSANFSLDFTVVGTINYNGDYSISTSDILGAFDSQGNVRGVANVSYNSLAGKYIVNLTVLGNTSGDTILFKFYDASADTVIDAINEPILFQANALYGNAISPYVITNVNVPFGIDLDAPIFADSVPQHTYIGKLSMNVFDSTIANPTFAFTDSVGNQDSANFYIRNDSVFTNALFDYDVDSVFTVKINGTEQGMTVYNSFEIRIFNYTYLGAYALYLNAPIFPDSVSIHTYVGKLSMDVYDSTLGNPTYAFTDSVGNGDSAFFYIRNDSLFTKALFNYDSNYIFFLKINGSVLGLNVFNTFQVRVSNATPNSVSEMNDLSFSMYPNPANSNVHIRLNANDEGHKINLYSTSGQLVQQINNTGQSELDIDVSSLQKGVYLLEVFSPLNRNVKRLIIY